MRLTPTQAGPLRPSYIGLATICALLSPLTLTAQAQTKAVQVPHQASRDQPKPLAQLPVRGRITDLKFAPVGTLLACLAELRVEGVDDSYNATHEWQLQVWDTRTRKLKWSVVRPYLMSFDFSPDGARLAFLESKKSPVVPPQRQPEQRIQVCQSQSGTRMRTIPVPNGSVINAPWEGVQFASDNHTLFLNQHVDTSDEWEGSWFDTQAGKCLRTAHIANNYKDDTTLPLVPTKEFWSASVFTDGIFLSPSGKTLLVDLQTTQSTPPIPTGDSNGSLTNYGHAGRVHHIWLCNLNGEFKRQITSTPHLTLKLSSNGTLLMCAGNPHYVQIFDVQIGHLLHTLTVPKHYRIQFVDSTNFIHATSGLISHDGKRAFATIAQDGGQDKDSQVGEWDMASGQFLALFGKWSSGYTSSTMALSSDDTVLAHPARSGSNHFDEYIQLWKLK